MKIQGVYKITNKINNKIYIGQSIDIYKRFREHKCNTNKKYKHPLYSSIRKYGIDNFELIILEHVENIMLLDEREQFWMDYYQCYNPKFGYNIASLAESSKGCNVGRVAWNKGKKMSKEDKQKCSERQKRLCQNPDYIKNLSIKTKQKYLDKEWKQNKLLKQKEALQNPEYKQKMLESRKKANLKLKELWKDPDYRKRMIESHKGQKAWNKGIPVTEEHRRNMSIAKKKEINNSGRFKKGHVPLYPKIKQQLILHCNSNIIAKAI